MLLTILLQTVLRGRDRRGPRPRTRSPSASSSSRRGGTSGTTSSASSSSRSCSLVVFGALLGGAFAADREALRVHASGRGLRRGSSTGRVRVVAVLLWGVLSLLYDFARAARRYAPAIGAWRGYGFARRALRGSWTRGLVLYLFWLLLGGAAWLAAIALAWTMPAASPRAIGCSCCCNSSRSRPLGGPRRDLGLVPRVPRSTARPARSRAPRAHRVPVPLGRGSPRSAGNRTGAI